MIAEIKKWWFVIDMPKEKTLFDANLARKVAEDYIKEHIDQYKRVEIVGSLRRGKPQVHDIDLVAIPIYPQDKKKIVTTTKEGIQIDMSLANESTYECIKLIRTGSTEHNKKLCILAKSKGWQLKANGEGLITPQGILHGEREILIALVGRYIEPRDRI